MGWCYGFRLWKVAVTWFDLMVSTWLCSASSLAQPVRRSFDANCRLIFVLLFGMPAGGRCFYRP